MTLIAVGNRDEALDILQDAMCKLVQKYANRDPAEWGPLFQTVLQNRIKDWYRRQSVRNTVLDWLGVQTEETVDALQEVQDRQNRTPEQLTQNRECIEQLESALAALPLRQQQAFMLRRFEDYDVKQVATIMGCSTGSVKTHYSRAIQALRKQLGEHWP